MLCIRQAFRIPHVGRSLGSRPRLLSRNECSSLDRRGWWVTVPIFCGSTADNREAEIRNGAVPHMLVVRTPSLKTFIAIPIFLMASGLQHDCHRYLADLKKYSLPSHPAFQRLIAPHYFAECLIYASFTLAGAPPRTFVNRTLLTALAFVVVNLGVTSYHTKQWYAQKFGQEQIAHKWNMVPYVF